MKQEPIKVFVIFDKKLNVTHHVKYPDQEKSKKISTDKWFKLYDKKETVCLQPLYEQ